MTELTRQVLHYQKTGEGLDELRAALAIWIYRFPSRYDMDIDDPGDFLLFNYSVIGSIIQRFQFSGSPFEAYLKSILSKRFCTFKYMQRQQATRNEMIHLSNIHDYIIRSPEENIMSVYDNDRYMASYPKGVKGLEAWLLDGSNSNKRRLIMLALKNSRMLRPDQMIRIAKLAGISAERLASACLQMRTCMLRRSQRIDLMRKRRNVLYIRIMTIQHELIRFIPPARRAALRVKLAILRRNIEIARHNLAHVPRRPSNWDIALVLGIPKGTVDSGMFYIKNAIYNTHLLQE